MANTLLKKTFLDYHSQIDYLKHKKLIIPDENKAIAILKKTSYYGLINGYKDIFKNPATNIFHAGTTFDEIYNLYCFDAELREILLKYILVFEKNVKSSISYHFSSVYGSGIQSYQNIANYDCENHISDVLYLFRKMNSKLKGKHPSPQIEHYMNTYNDVPLWVLTTDLTFGEIASMYKYLKGHCKTLVCKDFHNIGRNELGKILIILTKYRNICAHGNRLFNARTQDSIPDLIAHKKLRIPTINSRYQYGKSDLFASVISLKYVLDSTDFRHFYYELKKAIKKFSVSERTSKLMGFPPNWMSILRIKVY